MYQCLWERGLLNAEGRCVATGAKLNGDAKRKLLGDEEDFLSVPFAIDVVTSRLQGIDIIGNPRTLALFLPKYHAGVDFAFTFVF